MAINRVLSEKTARDIDQRVARVLRGLGNPEPPLRLEDVRELLDLDREFYTADDPGVIREAINRIRVAGTQVSKRPTLLYDAIKKFSLRALYLPDRKRILLDGSYARVAAGLTTLFISHRLGSTKIADRILVLDGGHIVEDGTHEELLVRRGLYHRMYTAQAAWYRRD